jgi:crotonobetainyl-CoA:carnitine CoA-transferase CaiB-like acyl-CoA transferase
MSQIEQGREPAAQPFHALRVLDLSTEIAGPYATKLLSDLGADVLKVEEPSGDPLRRRTASRTALPDGEDSALFRFLNAGKRSAQCDFCDSAQRTRLRDLASSADVVIANSRAEELLASNPRLCVVSITPWGTTGPYADRPATEFTLQAATGFIARRGTAERGPVGASGRLGEYAAGAFAAVAALAAWTHARATGRGRHVDVSIFETMIAVGPVFADLHGQFVGGLLPMYFDTPSVEPAADGWVGFAPVTSQQWEDFCLMIGRPEVGKDERFRWAQERSAHLPFFQSVIHSWTRARKVEEILEQTTLLRIPAAPVGDGETLPRTDHFVERGVFVENPHGFVQPRAPIELAEVARAPVARAPELGEDALAWRPRTASDVRVDGHSDEPLAGLRIVDLTAFWAGPFATQTLAMLGAEVIKVESIQRPDGIRFVNAKPGPPVWEASSIFQSVNTEKRAITLRLDRDEGRRALRALVERADALIENFSARVLEQFDLGWDTLSAWNPRLVLVRMPAWGLDGPWRDRTGFAMNIEQACGIAWRGGYPDQPICANVCDPVGGLHALVGLFAALEDRRRTGRGQQVEVPLVEPGLNLAAELVIERSAYGVRLSAEGNRGPDAAPQGVYRTGDGERIALAVANDAQWRALAAALADAPGGALLADPSLARESERRARHDQIDSVLSHACVAVRAADLTERLAAAGVPAQVLANAHRVMPHPQLEHRAYFQSLEHPHTGRARYPGLPFVGLADGRPRRPPPTLGQHNREVLAGELGIADDELARWERDGIIGTQPAWMKANPGEKK